MTPLWQTALRAIWMRSDGWVVRALAPFEWLYRSLWRWHSRRAAAPCPVGLPVVVVGNILVGGTGKTPVLIALVRHMQAQGLRVGVVARGYGRQGRDVRVLGANDTPDLAGDEAVLVMRQTGAPVAVGQQRALAARALRLAHPDLQIILSDDGLQHHALSRDLELLVFDQRGVGNGHLLPAGPLREPWPRRADACLVQPATPGIRGYLVSRRLAAYALDAQGGSHPLPQVCAQAQARGQRIEAWAGIAQPEVFFSMLRAQGIRLHAQRAWPDHARFDTRHLAPETLVLCTEKDAVKLMPLHPNTLAVPLLCELEADFYAWFDQRVAQLVPDWAPLSSPHGHTTA